jgi:hypothetical protein
MIEISEPDTVTEERAEADIPAATRVLESTALRATFWTVMDYGCSLGF